MSEKPLTSEQLLLLQEEAEYGPLDHMTVSKRHVRILTSLHFVLSTNDDLCTIPYANIPTMQHLIERFFGKKYQTKCLIYWIDDLIKRGYVAVANENELHETNFFSLTEHGILLFHSLYQTREALFESNSKNSVAFLN